MRVAHRWAPGSEPRCRRAHHRPPPRVRLAPRHPDLGHRPPGLRAQAAHRQARRLGAAQAHRRPVGLPEPGGEPARPRREQPRLHVAVLGRRHRARLRAHRPAPPRRRGDRRRRAHRRHGLGGAQQHRRGQGPQPRHRRQRQRPLLRPDDRRRGRPAGVAAAAARLRARAGEGQAGAHQHPGGRRPALRGAARAQGGDEGRARARRSCSPTSASSTSGRSTATTSPPSSPRCAAPGASAAR